MEKRLVGQSRMHQWFATVWTNETRLTSIFIKKYSHNLLVKQLFFLTYVIIQFWRLVGIHVKLPWTNMFEWCQLWRKINVDNGIDLSFNSMNWPHRNWSISDVLWSDLLGLSRSHRNDDEKFIVLFEVRTTTFKAKLDGLSSGMALFWTLPFFRWKRRL